MIVEYEDYVAFYGESEIIKKSFSRLSFDAEEIVRDICTGVDGYDKLENAFPDVVIDAKRVKRAICDIIHQMSVTDNLTDKAGIKSVTAGNEAITYDTDYIHTSFKAYRQMVSNYLCNARDKNGVNLLYMGAYPYRYL